MQILAFDLKPGQLFNRSITIAMRATSHLLPADSSSAVHQVKSTGLCGPCSRSIHASTHSSQGAVAGLGTEADPGRDLADALRTGHVAKSTRSPTARLACAAHSVHGPGRHPA